MRQRRFLGQPEYGVGFLFFAILNLVLLDPAPLILFLRDRRRTRE